MDVSPTPIPAIKHFYSIIFPFKPFPFRALYPSHIPDVNFNFGKNYMVGK